MSIFKNTTDAYKECIKANNLLPGIDQNAPSHEDELFGRSAEKHGIQ